MNCLFPTVRTRAGTILGCAVLVFASLFLASAAGGPARAANDSDRILARPPSHRPSSNFTSTVAVDSVAEAKLQFTATPSPAARGPELAAPALSSPANGASISCYSDTSLDLPLSWVQSDSPDLDGYEVELVKIGSGSLTFFGVTTSLLHTEEDEPEAVVGDECGDYSTYRWRVRALSLQDTASAWSAERQFEVSVFTSLGSGGEVIPLEPSDQTRFECSHSNILEVPFLWNESEDPFGMYELEVSPTSAGAAPTPLKVTLPSSAGAAYTAKLACDTAYRWRVRAVDPFGAFGPWSEMRTLELAAPTLADLPPPALWEPTPDSNFVCPPSRQLEVALRWQPHAPTQPHEIEIAKIASAAPGVTTAPSPSTRILPAPATATEAVLVAECGDANVDFYYYGWRVRALDQNGEPGPWSEERLFRLTPIEKMQPPSPFEPGADSVLGCSNQKSVVVPFYWNNPAESAWHTGYQVQLIRQTLNPPTQTVLYNQTLPFGQQGLNLELNCEATYHWRVRSLYGGLGEGEWSDGNAFRLDADAPSPAPPELLTPKAGAVIGCPEGSSLDLYFSWKPNRQVSANPASNSRYELELQSQRQDDTVVSFADYQMNPDTPFVQPSHPCGAEVRWRVRVVTADGAVGSWSETRSLSLRAGDPKQDVTPPTTPGIVGPRGRTMGAPSKVDCNSIRFDWNPAKDAGGVFEYRLYLYRFNKEAGIWTRRTLLAPSDPLATSLEPFLFAEPKDLYAWRVGAVDTAGNESVSDWGFFTCAA